jgi:hypothetical protein
MTDLNDFYIYVTSLGSSEIYPKNTSSQFTNNIHPPIHLQGSWNVGLIDCIFGDNIYSIKKHDPRYKIGFKIKYLDTTDSVLGEEGVIYYPTRNITGRGVGDYIRELERDVSKFLLNEKIIRNTSYLFKYSTVRGLVEMLDIAPGNFPGYYYPKATITWTFETHVASLLGVGAYSCEYNVEKKWRCPVTPFFNSPVRYINIYSNLVNSSHIADTEANILDVIPFADVRSKQFTPIVYKSLKRSVVDSISIDMRNPQGDVIPFVDGGSTMCILHFKQN